MKICVMDKEIIYRADISLTQRGNLVNLLSKLKHLPLSISPWRTIARTLREKSLSITSRDRMHEGIVSEERNLFASFNKFLTITVIALKSLYANRHVAPRWCYNMGVTEEPH